MREGLAAASEMRLAYLMSMYPLTSTTFIRREIAAMEKLGFQIDRIAIRPTRHLVRDADDQAEAPNTSWILGAAPAPLLGHLLPAPSTPPPPLPPPPVPPSDP